MFYGLTQMSKTYFDLNIETFIALAPCVIPSNLVPDINVPFAEGVGKYRSLGVYAVSGPNWTQDLQTICDNTSKDACDEARLLGEFGVPISVKNLEYLKQMSFSNRYQVYATPAEFLARP